MERKEETKTREKRGREREREEKGPFERERRENKNPCSFSFFTPPSPPYKEFSPKSALKKVILFENWREEKRKARKWREKKRQKQEKREGERERQEREQKIIVPSPFSPHQAPHTKNSPPNQP